MCDLPYIYERHIGNVPGRGAVRFVIDYQNLPLPDQKPVDLAGDDAAIEDAADRNFGKTSRRKNWREIGIIDDFQRLVQNLRLLLCIERMERSGEPAPADGFSVFRPHRGQG